jgi:hypothetical protein
LSAARLGAGVPLAERVEVELGSCGATVPAPEKEGEVVPEGGSDARALGLALGLALGEGEACAEAEALAELLGERAGLPLPRSSVPLTTAVGVSLRDAEGVWLRLRLCVRETAALAETASLRDKDSVRVPLTGLREKSKETEGAGDCDALGLRLPDTVLLALRDADALPEGEPDWEAEAFAVPAGAFVAVKEGCGVAVPHCAEAVALGVAREEGEGAREPSALADSRTVEETSELPLLEGVSVAQREDVGAALAVAVWLLVAAGELVEVALGEKVDWLLGDHVVTFVVVVSVGWASFVTDAEGFMVRLPLAEGLRDTMADLVAFQLKEPTLADIVGVVAVVAEADSEKFAEEEPPPATEPPPGEIVRAALLDREAWGVVVRVGVFLALTDVECEGVEEAVWEPLVDPECEGKDEPVWKPLADPEGEEKGESDWEPLAETEGVAEGESDWEPLAETEGEAEGKTDREPPSDAECEGEDVVVWEALARPVREGGGVLVAFVEDVEERDGTSELVGQLDRTVLVTNAEVVTLLVMIEEFVPDDDGIEVRVIEAHIVTDTEGLDVEDVDTETESDTLGISETVAEGDEELEGDKELEGEAEPERQDDGVAVLLTDVDAISDKEGATLIDPIDPLPEIEGDAICDSET